MNILLLILGGIGLLVAGALFALWLFNRASGRAVMRGLGWALALLVLPLFASSCALIRPGDDPIVVRTQDVISNSFDAWDVAMDIHAANSTRESPQIYAAAEKIRTGFPPLHRALRNALKGYQGATTKDPEKLRLAVLGILGDIEALAPPGSKFAQTVALIRASYLGGGA